MEVLYYYYLRMNTPALYRIIINWIELPNPSWIILNTYRNVLTGSIKNVLTFLNIIINSQR